MAENPEGVIMPTGAPASLAQGDVPVAVRRRYLTEGRGAQLAYYTDQTTRQPAFQDGGRRLSADRANPAVIKDMLAIAEHRGWSQIRVRGSVEFRREAWMQAQGRGLEVVGYRPTARDRQALDRRVTPLERGTRVDAGRGATPDRRRERRGDPGVASKPIEVGGQADEDRRTQWEIVASRFRRATPEQAGRDPELRSAQSRLATVEAVVRRRAEPAVADRIITAARERIASWLEQGASFELQTRRQAPNADRGRERHR